MKNNIKSTKHILLTQGCAFFILFIGFAMFLSATALSEENSINKDVLDIKDRGVFILEPLLVYENAYTEQRFGAVDESTRGILSKESSSKATEVLSSCGGKPCTLSLLSDSEKAQVAQACYKLQDSSEHLTKQWKDKSSFFNEFALIKNITKCDLILVNFVKTKVGVGGSWDFINTGTIIPGTSTTAFKSVLIDCNSGKIAWSGGSIERALPEKYVIIRCLKTLYTDFPGYSKNSKK